MRGQRLRLSRREFALAGSVALAGCAYGVGLDEQRVPPKLFYLGPAKVFSMDPAGGAPVTLVDQAPKDGSRPGGLNDGIALDLVNRHVYWTNMGRAAENDVIMRSDLDGSNVTTIEAGRQCSRLSS
jgi:hypothetical protein